MDYFIIYLRDLYNEENSKIIINDINEKTPKSKRDIKKIIQIIVSWFCGTIVSLIPTFLYTLSELDEFDWQQIAFAFFAKEDVFLVCATLTIGALLELVFSEENGISKYIFSGLELILIATNLLIFGFLKFGHEFSLASYLGIFLLLSCATISIIGYIVSCSKKGGR